MRYEINGNIMQTVAIDLAPGETVYSQTNTMAWMNDQITMNTHTGGGLFAGLKRTFGGGSLFVGVICALVSISIFISIHNEPIKPKGT